MEERVNERTLDLTIANQKIIAEMNQKNRHPGINPNQGPAQQTGNTSKCGPSVFEYSP